MRQLIQAQYEVYANVPLGAAIFFKKTIWGSGLLILAAMGMWAVWKLGGEREKGKLRVWLGWGAGIVFAAFLVPLLDMVIARLLERGPLTIDLPRGLRFFVFLALFVAVWGAHETAVFLQQRWGRTWLTRLAAPLALVLALTVSDYRRPLAMVKVVLKGVRVIMSGPAAPSMRAELHAAVKQLPEGSLILPLGMNGLSIRHMTLRPVVATPKDFNLYIASKGEELRKFLSLTVMIAEVDPAYERFRQLAAKHGWPGLSLPVSDEERLANIRLVGEMTDADVYALEKNRIRSFPITGLGDLIWENEDFALVARNKD